MEIDGESILPMRRNYREMIDTLGDSFMLVHAIFQKDYVFAKLWYFITLDSQYSWYAVDEGSRALFDFDPIHTSFEEKARDAKHLQDAANNRKQNHNLMFDSTSHQQWHTSDDQTASCSQVLVATNENFGWTEALLLEAIQRDSSRQIDYLLKMKGLILISNRNYIHVACLVVLKLLEVAILLANPFGMISFDGTDQDRHF